MSTLACASIVSRAGVRTAVPKRSSTVSAAAGHSAHAIASNGAASMVIA
jgi:hypothetical protein